MALSTIALFISIYELIRYAMQSGPLPEGDPQVLLWVMLICGGSLIGTMGTYMLQKGMLMASSLIFCCAMAPATPNMIVLSQGDQY